jgi:hypothetical protein
MNSASMPPGVATLFSVGYASTTLFAFLAWGGRGQIGAILFGRRALSPREGPAPAPFTAAVRRLV